MKKFILPVLIVIAVLVVTGLYLYNKPHQNVSHVAADVVISADSLCIQYVVNESAGDKLFLGKVIEVNGIVGKTIATDSTANIQLDVAGQAAGISCSFVFPRSAPIVIPAGRSTVKIKGRCTGFLADVNLVDCVIVQ